MAAIGLGDLIGEDWEMGSRGRPNMSAKALRRFCVALVVILPLSRGGLVDDLSLKVFDKGTGSR